jgi:hypothetical protein
MTFQAVVACTRCGRGGEAHQGGCNQHRSATLQAQTSTARTICENVLNANRRGYQHVWMCTDVGSACPASSALLQIERGQTIASPVLGTSNTHLLPRAAAAARASKMTSQAVDARARPRGPHNGVSTTPCSDGGMQPLLDLSASHHWHIPKCSHMFC